MRFSDRIGATAIRDVLQVGSINADLRNCLWEAVRENYLKDYTGQYSKDIAFRNLVKSIYVDFFKRTSDSMPAGHAENINSLKHWFFEAEWWSVYNFIEFLLAEVPDRVFLARIDYFLAREKAGYRIVSNQIVAITDPVEIDAVREASTVEKYAGAAEHIRVAVSLFSKKPEPDYRNAIKEAISAVKSVVKAITEKPNATLGEALKIIDKKAGVHPALREAMNKLYGYTNDEDGIRHAIFEGGKIDEAEAKFMIVTCSAFVTFCIQRSQ